MRTDNRTQHLTITRPDDWHLHVRDGDALATVVPHTAAQFGRAIIMPNLRPPVTTAAQALAYKARIQAAVPAGVSFEPLMTLYLTDNLPADEIRRAKDAGVSPAFGGENTYGGYSKSIVVKDHFVLKINHKEKNFAKIAPLLCAGITMYSPLKKWKVKKGMNVGIVGLGGLGQMGVKIAKALGAKVILFTTSENKVKDGLKFGASDVCISNKEEQMEKYMGQLDLIANTVAASHKLDVYLNLLKKDGTMTLVGAPDQPHPSIEVFNLIFKRRRLAGSLVGGLKETQEMLNFCAKHKIVSDIEAIKMDYINEAYARMLKSNVKYRFVIDMKSL